MTDTTFNDAVKVISSVLSTKQNAIEWQTAMLGDGHGTVIATQDNTVYCRLTHNSSVIEVINYRVAPVDGLLVRIAKTPEMPNHWQVIGQADQRVDEGNSTVDGGVIYNTPNHHRLHEYLGVDQVNVDWRQINTLKVYPYSGMTIGVIAGLIPRTGADIVVPTQTLDLTSHVPTTGALYALISVDSSGTLAVTDGTAVSGLLSLTLSDIPDTPTGNFRLAAVRLYAGQTSISESLNTNDIRDLRWPQERLASGIGVDDLPTPIDIPHGGTSATTASAAINNLLPTQTGQAGNGLLTDGFNPYWGPTGGGGSGTIVITSLPVGTIVPFGGTSIPSGWLECDGAAVSRTTYADLFTIVGTTYGVGDGSTTFNLPDLRGRTSIGKGTGSGLTARTIGATGGTETHTLSAAEIPSHSHTYVGLTTYGAGVIGSVVANVDTSTNISTSAAGGGGAHNNMQPFLVTAYIIKYTDTATSSLIFDDGANPENVTLTAATGDDVYAARRDHVHAVDQGIAPTWTATHSWTNDSDTAHAMYLYRGDDPTVHGPAFAGFRAYGTLASPSDAGINAVFARFSGRGRGSGAWPSAATGRIDIAATEAQTSSAQGTDIRFYTTPNGSTTSGLAATFGQDKSLAVVGAISASNYAGTVSGGGTIATGGFTLTVSGNSTINGSLIGNITGGGTLATGGFTLTVPATGTAALLQVANTFTVGPQTINTGADANKGIISKANSASQTGNLLELQNSSGTGLSAFSGAGNLRIGSATVRDGAGLEVTKTITSTAQDPTLSYYYGLRTTASASPTGNTVSDWRLYGLDLTAQANNANNITGQIIAAQFAGQINMTGGTLTSLYGGLFANNGINASGTATTTSTFAGRFQLGKSGAGTWSIGTASLLSVGKPSVSAGTLSGTTLYALNIEDMNGANSGTWTNRFAVNSAGGRWVLANTADEVLMTLTGHTTQSAATALATLTRNDALTNAIGTVLTLSQNSTGTAAAGFGGAIALNLESSNTADQAAAAIKWLWTDATHSTKTSRADIETTGPGKCAAWGYNGIDGTARTIIANGTGDVTEGITVQYVASEVTGTDSFGGVAYLEPGDSFVINTDATNVLTLACAADGSVTVQRTAGTDTYKFQCWAVWV